MQTPFFLRRADKLLLALVYPRKTICLSCGRLSHGAHLCPACAAEMEAYRLRGDLCPQCGHALTSSPCSFCKGDVPGRMLSLWQHKGAPRQLVLQLKHGCVAEAATVLGREMAERVRTMHLLPDTVVTWVTMPRTRRKNRGVDHGRLLAETIAREAGLPCRQLLIRRNQGKTQRGLTRKQRLRNLKGMFSCPQQLNHPVLLVDDVMTTSATARVCMEALLQAGAVQAAAITATQA